MMSDRERRRTASSGSSHSRWSRALLLPAASVAPCRPDRDPTPHADAADTAGSPLDLRTVSFGQRGTELVLRITTAGEWEPSAAGAPAGHALCVKLFYGKLATPRARICVVDRGAKHRPG